MCHGFFPCLSHSSASLPSSASRSVASANLSQFLRNPLPGRTRLERGGRGEAENEERAVNHAGKMEAVERAKDEMDRQVTKGKEKRMRQRENGWLKSVTDFSIS